MSLKYRWLSGEKLDGSESKGVIHKASSCRVDGSVSTKRPDVQNIRSGFGSGG